MLTQFFSLNSNSTKLAKNTVIGFISLLVISFIAIKLAWSQPYEPAAVVDTSIQFNTISEKDINIHYAYSGDTNKIGVIFVHGTPGGWAAFEGYLINRALQKNFFMVSVDRPGWGASTTQDKSLNGLFDHQARSIDAIFKQYPDKKWIVVGHSLGASLAPQIALESKDSVSGLVLLAGSISPKLGSPRWYNYAAQTWLVSKMVGKQMTSANREIIKLRKQLKIMNEQIQQSKINAHVHIVQGLKDKLVSPKNPAFAIEQWQDKFLSLEVTELEEAGHFIPWQQSTSVLTAIINVADKSLNTGDSN